MTFCIVKAWSRAGQLLHIMEWKETNTLFATCYFSSMFPELVDAPISIGKCLLNFKFELILSDLKFCMFFSPHLLLTTNDFLSSGSFLRKLYTSDQECPRSYDKLRFDPTYVNPLHVFFFLQILVLERGGSTKEERN